MRRIWRARTGPMVPSRGGRTRKGSADASARPEPPGRLPCPHDHGLERPAHRSARLVLDPPAPPPPRRAHRRRVLLGTGRGCWNIRPAGTSPWPSAAGSGEWTIDYAFPEPAPPPVTTIGWRLGHLIVGVLGTRLASHFGGPETDYGSFAYAGTAEEALHQLDTRYAEWTAGVRSLGQEGLEQPCGPSEGPFAEDSMARLVLHITREIVHHGAEIGTLRDLWAHRPLTG